MSDYTIASDLVKDPASELGAFIPRAALELRKLHPEIAGWEQCGVGKDGQAIIRLVVRSRDGKLACYDPSLKADTLAALVIPTDLKTVLAVK